MNQETLQELLLNASDASLDPADPPVFGTARGSETYDGALAQWLGIRALWDSDDHVNASDVDRVEVVV